MTTTSELARTLMQFPPDTEVKMLDGSDVFIRSTKIGSLDNLTDKILVNIGSEEEMNTTRVPFDTDFYGSPEGEN